MARLSLVTGMILVTGASISACDRAGGDDVSTRDPFAQRSSAAPEDQFGKEFGKAFRADPNSTPRPIVEHDMKPVSYTAEPVEVD